MQWKVRPEDFRVQELMELPTGPAAMGDYQIHLVIKEKLSTHEALAEIVKRARVNREDIAYAGLKDRQAVTEQYITIKGRTARIESPNLKVRPVGSARAAITSKHSSGNRFTIVLRDLSRFEAVRLRRELSGVLRTGSPNYFDDQRFNCLRHGQGIVMVQVARGRYERALQQLVASPSPAALTGDVKLKRLLQKNWGDWGACERIARGPIYGKIFQHLMRKPGDFVGALQLLPTRTLLIHAFAFQSLIWNRACSQVVRDLVPRSRRVLMPTAVGMLDGWRSSDRESLELLHQVDTPLPAPGYAGGDPGFRDAVDDEMASHGVTFADLAKNSIPGMVLQEEPRALVVFPQNFDGPRLAADSMHEGRTMAKLAFDLPRGAYATMLIKRLLSEEAVPRQGMAHRNRQAFGARLQHDREERERFERGGDGYDPRGHHGGGHRDEDRPSGGHHGHRGHREEWGGDRYDDRPHPDRRGGHGHGGPRHGESGHGGRHGGGGSRRPRRDP